MTSTSPPRDVAPAAQQLFDHDPCAQSQGIELLRAGDGFAMMRLTVRPDQLNPHGICHGGITYLLADTVFSYAMNADRDGIPVTTGSSVVYLAPVTVGDVLTAQVNIVKDGPKTGVVDVEVHNQDGELVFVYRAQTLRTSRTPEQVAATAR